MTVRILSVLAVMLAQPSLVMAQTSLTAPPSIIAPAPQPVPSVAGSMRVTNLITAIVYTDRHVRLGQLRDVIILPTGTLAILEVSGALALGGPWIGVPLSALTWDRERQHLVLPGATEANLVRQRPFDFSTVPRG